MNHRRAVSRLSAPIVVLVALAVATVGCSALDSELVVDWPAQAERSLAELEVDPAIAECVLRLAEDELAAGPLADAELDELIVNCSAAQSELDAWNNPVEPEPALAFSDEPQSFGDDPALDRLWTACEEGSGAACDQLFDRSPIGSDYEEFGVSCGDRADVLHCRELDAEPGD
jgi:hypothetical protein